jgi:formylglycine-generating enzyme required for sulfatase activity
VTDVQRPDRHCSHPGHTPPIRPAWLVAVTIVVALVVSANSVTLAASPVEQATPRPTYTLPPTLTATATNTPRPTYTLPPTPTATATPGLTVTLSPTPTATRSPIPTATPTATATPAPRATAEAALAPTTTPERAEPAAGATRVRAADGMVMIYVPSGSFIMGSTLTEVKAAEAACRAALGDQVCRQNDFAAALPRRTVYLDGFWIDRTEVTNAQFARFVQATRYRTDAATNAGAWVQTGPDAEQLSGVTWRQPDGPDSDYADRLSHPVVNVSWNDASAYCEWVGARLPGEAEWEKAARGRDGRTWPWGNRFTGRRVNFCDVNCPLTWRDREVDDGYARTAPVGSFRLGASPYGALDMAGNVAEWVADRFSPNYYATAPTVNPTGPDAGDARVVRGGSWGDGPAFLHVALRTAAAPEYARDVIGFRCATTDGRPSARSSLLPDYDAVVTADSANLRAGPGTGYPIIGKVTRGERVAITGRSPDGEWVAVRILRDDGAEGWLALFLLEPRIDLLAVAVVEEIAPPPTVPPPTAVRPAEPASSPEETAEPEPAPPAFDVPPGQALFVAYNYTALPWDINFANYLLVVPPRADNEEFAVATLAVAPGQYSWQANSPGGPRFKDPLTNASEFAFSVNAGDVYEVTIR